MPKENVRKDEDGLDNIEDFFDSPGNSTPKKSTARRNEEYSSPVYVDEPRRQILQESPGVYYEITRAPPEDDFAFSNRTSARKLITYDASPARSGRYPVEELVEPAVRSPRIYAARRELPEDIAYYSPKSRGNARILVEERSSRRSLGPPGERRRSAIIRQNDEEPEELSEIDVVGKSKYNPHESRRVSEKPKSVTLS